MRYGTEIKQILSFMQNIFYKFDGLHPVKCVDQTMQILHFTNKGQRLNTLERFEIYKLTKNGIQLNDTRTQ
jgi:hypothetical protein